MIRALLLSAALLSGVFAQMDAWHMTPPGFETKTLPHIRLIDAKVVTFEHTDTFTEISALAYEKQTKRLYALSDRGVLHILKFAFDDQKITALELLESHPLSSAKGKRFAKEARDSEGMVLSPKGLLISFEREPRLAYFDRRGREQEGEKIAKPLRDIANYEGKNKALEAVAYHPLYGVLTAPERPLRSQKNRDEHTLYGKNRTWRFKAHGSVTAMEAMPDGRVLVLERDYALLSGRQIITLQSVAIEGCKNRLCPSTLLAQFDSDAGWQLDNFEGLTHLRDNLYLMISDDNDAFFQKTIMVLFEIKA